jgi:hypothetical protein
MSSIPTVDSTEELPSRVSIPFPNIPSDGNDPWAYSPPSVTKDTESVSASGFTHAFTSWDNQPPIYENPPFQSLFINHLHRDFLDEDLLRNMVQNICWFGKVSRIDFVSKPEQAPYHMAFIHMEYWYKNENVEGLFRAICDGGSGYFDVYGANVQVEPGDTKQITLRDITWAYHSHRYYKNYFTGMSILSVLPAHRGLPSRKRNYIRFQENKTPIPQTTMNIHQLAAGLIKSEAEIVGLVELVRLQREQIQQQWDKMYLYREEMQQYREEMDALKKQVALLHG